MLDQNDQNEDERAGTAAERKLATICKTSELVEQSRSGHEKGRRKRRRYVERRIGRATAN
jgi:hypothetical protein